MKKITLSLLFIYFILEILYSGQVNGIVLDEKTKAPLMGANVIVKGSTNGTASDENGNFTLFSVPSGEQILMVSYIGYKTIEKKIRVLPSRQGLLVTIKLPVSTIDLQEYVITSRRGRREKITDAPAAISIITSSKIRRESHANLGDYFKNVKGVDFTASGLDSYNLSARGFNSSFSSRLLTLTDGRMANVPSLRLIAYNVIPATSDDVEQIEVVLGPSSALYGPNAHSGVVNIITKRPSEYSGTNLSFTGGTRDFRKWQVRHSGSAGHWSYKLSFVDFSAFDWEWIDEEEKKAHMSPWIDNDGRLGSDLDNGDLGNWKWDGYNIIIDKNQDGNYSYIQGIDSIIYAMHDVWENNINPDLNNDGLTDTVNFYIENQRADLRLDYNFSRNHFMSINYGQAVASNINITGIGRYLADNWIYQYYQYRYVYNNWFTQVYLNTSNAGNTRNLRSGDKIFDQSKFFHWQLQHSLDWDNFFHSTFIWGMDYQRTLPETFGTILPDGSGGMKPESYKDDGLDNDGDGEVDEWDELFVTNEYGLYGQMQSKITDNFEVVAAGRFDLHSGLTENGGFRFLADPLSGGTLEYSPQWSPKIGLLWKPYENQTFRLTSARAFETPSSQGLYLDILVAIYEIFPVKARGNLNGYHYNRDANDELMIYDVRDGSYSEFRLTQLPDSSVIYIPSVLGRPSQFVQPEDYRKIDPVRSEVVHTNEFGYSGLIGKRTRATFDLYHSTYNDFVSDLTWVTPVVLDTSNGLDNFEIVGLVATAEYDGIADGGDGIPGAYWVDYNSDKWQSILSEEGSDFWGKEEVYRKGTRLYVENGDTLGAYYSDDVVDNIDPIELIFTNINYGKVNIWGCDASVYTFITGKLTLDMNFSYLGTRSFYNFLTKGEDPINAPMFKINANLGYNHDEGHNLTVGFRYIPEFDWSAGVFFGTIPSYLITDVSMSYKVNEAWSFMLNASNVFNDVHREIIGGPELGRHFKFQIAASL